MAVSTGPVVVPDPVSNKYARVVTPQMPLECSVRNRKGHLSILRHCAFVITIERIERVVIEAGLIGGAESSRLLERERGRTRSIPGIRNCVVLRISCVGSYDRSGIIRRSLPVDVS